MLTSASDPLFTYSSDGTRYLPVPATTSLNDAFGYWAYFTSNRAVSLLPTPRGIIYSRPLTAKRYLQIGNPSDSWAWVSGVDCLYTYNAASSQYTIASVLAPGQGGFAVSIAGGTVVITASATADSPAPAPAPRPAAPPGPALAGRPNAFLWDFSDCGDHGAGGTIASDGAGASRCHLSLPAGGAGTVQVTFTMSADPSNSGPWTMLLTHSASGAGSAPVQIAVNGQVVYDDAQRGGGSSSGDSTITASEITAQLQRGNNTVSWSLEDGATVDYWLSSISISAPTGEEPLPSPVVLPPDTPPGGAF